MDGIIAVITIDTIIIVAQLWYCTSEIIAAIRESK